MENKNFSLTKKVCMLLPFYLLAFLPLSAQTFTQRIQSHTQNGASVTIHHDKAIDNLVNGPHAGTAAKKMVAVEKPVNPVVTTKRQDPKPETLKRTDHNEAASITVQQENETVAAVVDTVTVKKATGHTIKTTGYRVQVYAGGNSRKDRQTAERIGNELRMLFPQEAVYVHFYSPRWICRMGNFRTQEEAHRSLQEVKRLGYSAATIVKGKITLQY